MKRFYSDLAVPFFLVLACLLTLSSCSNAQTLYSKGHYQAAINKINRTANPTVDDHLLKARSYVAMGSGDKAMESLLLYLLLAENPSAQDRAFTVSNFIKYNVSDRLSTLVLAPTDGLEAQKVLYRAHVALSERDDARSILASLSRQLDARQCMDLMFENPVDADYMLASLTSWYSSIDESEKTDFLQFVGRFSSEIQMSEAVAKQFLSLTDILMEDPFFTEDDIRLSVLLKTKGNILEKLYDKVNARIYWSQAYRLNPDDPELAKRMQ